jgi:small nuclear ribonucleoprotein (snRNP)-like protein
MKDVSSQLLEGLKGKQVDITTTAGAHIVGLLKDADGQFLLVISDDEKIYVPLAGVALITISTRGPGDIGVQEAT